MATAPRRRRIGHRRRVEDEGDDDGRTEALDIEEESLSEGSLLTDEDDAGEDSDTSNIEEASPNSPNTRKKSTNGMSRVAALCPQSSQASTGKAQVSDTELVLHGLSVTDGSNPPQDMQLEDIDITAIKTPSAPVIVSSASAMGHAPASQADRRRQEQEDYKRRREEDPAFVPKRGAFFMHDHRNPGSAAHGFRPLGRGRGRGDRGIIGGPYSPLNYIQNPSDPTTSSSWTHDMHDVVADSVPRRPRQMTHGEGPANGTGFIPTCGLSPTPINRTLSTEKHTGNAQVRVFLPHLMKSPAIFPGVPVKQYTKLPDHRPPLRRDKPVRISLPNHTLRYVFPASDRSFTFIPRALRPNQQRIRGKPRPVWTSAGGFSRRNSVLEGSYYGSVYSPSIAMSRHSSTVQERDMIFSTTGSAVSRPPIPADVARPVVRLPPATRPDIPVPGATRPPAMMQFDPPLAVQEASISDLPPPQRHSLPQKPSIQENRPASLPMHQPRPQKNISVANIEPFTLAQGPHAAPLPFHQQVPLQVANGLHQEAYVHACGPYPCQHAKGTPLSQIPERAIHAALFQPNNYNQPLCYNQTVYQPQPQPQAHGQQGFYYTQGFNAPPTMAASAAAPPFVPGRQHGGFAGHVHGEHPASQSSVSNTPSSSNLVAQELNGMVYYYDASQIQPVNAYQPYPAIHGFQPSVMGMGGMVTHSPDGFYYPQHAQGIYYSQ